MDTFVPGMVYWLVMVVSFQLRTPTRANPCVRVRVRVRERVRVRVRVRVRACCVYTLETGVRCRVDCEVSGSEPVTSIYHIHNSTRETGPYAEACVL